VENKGPGFRNLQRRKTTMEITGKKIVIWCGNAPNQRALANKLASKYALAGIVLDEHRAAQKKRTLFTVIRGIFDRIRFAPIYNAWKKLMAYYGAQYPQWPDVPQLRVPGINDPQTAAFTSALAPDLVIVSGTGLIKKPLVSLPVATGIINLHTGLSPFVKGGPNCTNWCIANNEWHLTGNTIMWLNAGIDSGNIITTERIDIRGEKNLYKAHLAVMEHAHDLYIRAVDYLLHKTEAHHAVPQDSIGKGNLYLTKMWTAGKRQALLKNWKKRNSNTILPEVPTVGLPAYKQHE
jgi:Formyl transferase